MRCGCGLQRAASGIDDCAGNRVHGNGNGNGNAHRCGGEGTMQSGSAMRVLGIETSCDETGLAVYDSRKGLLCEVLYSQAQLHAGYGGVVPELASRDHIRKILPLARQVFDKAGMTAGELDGVAYTAGPGLIGALLVGAALGRSLAWALAVPAIGVHHMEGHLLSPMLENPDLDMPFVALLVSGGHTQLLHAEAMGHYRLLGDCVDDAAGEAFDKIAKLLGLAYPGGAAVERLAEHGRAGRFRFPRPMLDRPGMDFSFSGLKTSVLNCVRTLQEQGQYDEQTRADIALAFQDAVVDTLTRKCQRAIRATGAGDLVIAGGVSANRRLRATLDAWSAREGIRMHCPSPGLCTDNGAMIAYAGCLRLLAGAPGEGLGIRVRPRWPMAELPALPGRKA